MIFYFSGTGNSRWAAQQLATLLEDTALDISQLRQLPDLTAQLQIGLVFPVYAWGPPEPVLHFVKSLPRTKAFCFAVCTCGSQAGHAMKKLAQIWPVNSSYSLVMPNNYVIGSDLDDQQTIRCKILAAQKEIKSIAIEIRERKSVYRVAEGSLAGLKTTVVNYGFNRYARGTGAFHVEDTCNGCGLCARNCPAHTISLKDGKPVWAKKCFQCLRCINECPQRAIEYGKATKTRGRYTFEKNGNID